MGMKDYSFAEEINGKYYYTASFYATGMHNKVIGDFHEVRVPKKEGIYIASISLNMLSAYGGDFDQNDTIYADIDLIDHQEMNESHGYGGVSGHHWGYFGQPSNQCISSYIGRINEHIRFRITIAGDDYVGATVMLMEL